MLKVRWFCFSETSLFWRPRESFKSVHYIKVLAVKWRNDFRKSTSILVLDKSLVIYSILHQIFIKMLWTQRFFNYRTSVFWHSWWNTVLFNLISTFLFSKTLSQLWFLLLVTESSPFILHLPLRNRTNLLATPPSISHQIWFLH
jgi:hypothetical protein